MEWKKEANNRPTQIDPPPKGVKATQWKKDSLFNKQCMNN